MCRSAQTRRSRAWDDVAFGEQFVDWGRVRGRGAAKKEIPMRCVNRWSASSLWVAAMIGLWFVLVPAVVSWSTWMIATLGGPIFLVSAGIFWDTHRPVPSVLQSRAQSESAEAAGPSL